MAKLTDIQVVALDTYKGNLQKFSVAEGNDAIRNKIIEVCGGEWNYYMFMDNKYKVFQIIAEVMTPAMNASLGTKFDQFAEFKDTAMGDKNYFLVEDNTLFPVYTAARGNWDIERQKITQRAFSVATEMKMIKFYDEFDRFMAGKIDFSTLTNRAIESFVNHVGLLISGTIYGSYAAVGTDYKATGAFSATTLNDIMKHVKAATGAERLSIWGDVSALSMVADGFGYSDTAKDKANMLGYYGTFRGADFYALPQAYTPKTTTLAVDSSHIIILPAGGEKIVKVAFEGDALVESTEASARNDGQMEFLYGRRVGSAALTVPAGKYGFYKFI